MHRGGGGGVDKGEIERMMAVRYCSRAMVRKWNRVVVDFELEKAKGSVHWFLYFDRRTVMKTLKWMVAMVAAFMVALAGCGGGGAASPTPLAITKAQLVASVPAPVIPKGASTVNVQIDVDVEGAGITTIVLKNETSGKTVTIATGSGIGSATFNNGGTMFAFSVGSTTVTLLVNNVIVAKTMVVNVSCAPDAVYDVLTGDCK